MNTTNSCCEKCEVKKPYAGCNDYLCGCHASGTETPQPPHEPQEGWEKSFDDVFHWGLYDGPESDPDYATDRVKAFIKQLLAADRAQTIEAERKRMWEVLETVKTMAPHFTAALTVAQDLIYPKETNEEV